VKLGKSLIRDCIGLETALKSFVNGAINRKKNIFADFAEIFFRGRQQLEKMGLRGDFVTLVS
jgi:hypothetical protein